MAKKQHCLYADTPVFYVKGVGPRLGDKLKSLGFHQVEDLLHHYPRLYISVHQVEHLSPELCGRVVSLLAHIRGVSFRGRMTVVTLMDSNQSFGARFFRAPFRGYFNMFRPGSLVRIEGELMQAQGGGMEFVHPAMHVLTKSTPSKHDVGKVELTPLYSSTGGLKSSKWQSIILAALEKLVPPKDYVPEWLLQKYNLPPLEQCLHELHKPCHTKAEQYLNFNTPAQRRIIFEDFFCLGLKHALNKHEIQKHRAPQFTKTSEFLERAQRALPFTLTTAQKRVLGEIQKDLARSHPMHRLVQGDVGCGKTVLAFLSAGAVCASNYQSVLMAPTEILAVQHWQNAKKWLVPQGIEVGCILGKHTKAQKAAILQDLSNGRVQFLIGTHAALEDSVQFKNLGLVIVDEQHRFGVHQRLRLKKGGAPHFLVMTATPIPRTLSLGLHGDLDISVVDEIPPGRKKVITRVAREKSRASVMDFLLKQLQAQRQVYVVCPLVEESERVDLKNATTEYERYKKHFPEFTVGLLHGRMPSDEKRSTVEAFAKNQIRVLVSTTVIEVGVDVPNATVMLIEHAERFGLSQLHQMRGRVGRGVSQSYCVLMLRHASAEALKRLSVLEKHASGFDVAEKDLEIRGPGQVMGVKQSGFERFRMANLVRDAKWLSKAREAAAELVRRDPNLSAPEHAALREHLLKTSKTDC